jgi:hypothetical protein
MDLIYWSILCTLHMRPVCVCMASGVCDVRGGAIAGLAAKLFMEDLE